MSKKDLNEMELDLDFELGAELGEMEESQIVGGGYTSGSAAHSYTRYCTSGSQCSL